MNVAQETLGFRRAGLSPALSLLMSAFALPIPPAALSSRLHRPTERSPTITRLIQTSWSERIALQFDSTSRRALWSRPRLAALNWKCQVSLAQSFPTTQPVGDALVSAAPCGA